MLEASGIILNIAAAAVSIIGQNLIMAESILFFSRHAGEQYIQKIPAEYFVQLISQFRSGLGLLVVSKPAQHRKGQDHATFSFLPSPYLPLLLPVQQLNRLKIIYQEQSLTAS